MERGKRKLAQEPPKQMGTEKTARKSREAMKEGEGEKNQTIASILVSHCCLIL
jgi:hypothetical protein